MKRKSDLTKWLEKQLTQRHDRKELKMNKKKREKWNETWEINV